MLKQPKAWVDFNLLNEWIGRECQTPTAKRYLQIVGKFTSQTKSRLGAVECRAERRVCRRHRSKFA
ncbi:uncharacterized protein PHALS_10221 [Plasmopara halstedii]|uniref:Uncharacterized protein n=1 Tax=Plasmopara halstedii TaxID=4781 RepID=A0A0P1AGT9_PLAHL|nr:uncharacterized protein PHALS_10221 [Plasmopara halstedii]CEG39998.1 hypothetical protein PHALS_10221 [Plasmopara halstedii]|eukprot:XP_024576367.1 hypothetical protein PHALS_10221 [Plasmopara halstedii]